MEKCSIRGCTAASSRRGWCDKHYRRWKAHGDPTKSLLLRGSDWKGKCKSCGKKGTFYKDSHECRKCRDARTAAWHVANPEKKRAYAKKSNARRYQGIREAVFSAYGHACSCCGETESAFLCIDHMNGGGNKHRLEIGQGSLYPWLVQNNFPQGFQVLCHNCNFAKSHGGCPHQKEKA